jgi:glyoxylase-like metal-dependent hydrolase (beta-lactamase superfamily II)
VLISGDHLLGRVSLYYDYGWTPDPGGEFLNSLDVVGSLDASLCLSGHGRPFRDVREHVEANKREVNERIARVRSALEQGGKTPFEIVPALIGEENRGNPMMVQWGLGEVLVYLRYLERREQATKLDDGEAEDVQRWALAA